MSNKPSAAAGDDISGLRISKRHRSETAAAAEEGKANALLQGAFQWQQGCCQCCKQAKRVTHVHKHRQHPGRKKAGSAAQNAAGVLCWQLPVQKAHLGCRCAPSGQRRAAREPHAPAPGSVPRRRHPSGRCCAQP
jgi:hypothetical protein